MTASGYVSLEYDHAGRLISRSPTATPTTELEGYAWDVQDQLRQVRTAGAVSEVLDYDPTGLLLFRRVGTVGTWYVGKMATVTATVSTTCLGAAACGASITPPITTTATPAVAVHLLLGGTRIATVRPPNQAAATAAFAEVLYYHRDYQGSVVGTSRRGAGVDGLSGAKYRYTPYGQLDKADGRDRPDRLGAGLHRRAAARLEGRRGADAPPGARAWCCWAPASTTPS